MENTKTSKQPLLYALIVIVAVVIALSLYYYMLKPQMDKRDAINEKVAVQTTELQTAKTQLADLQQPIKPSDTTEASKKIPNGANMDTLVDDLQAAESASATQITNFNFNAYDAQSEVAKQAQATTALTEAEEKSAYAVEEKPVSSVPESTLPKYTKMITMQLAVSGYSESDVRNFIDQLENANRVYNVEKVKFEAPDTEDATSEDIVAAKIQVTTFYYEVPVDEAAQTTNEEPKDEATEDTTKDTTK